MYIPRLRRINDVVAEIKEQDPESNITYRVIKELIAAKEITSMKYGNAWLINLDELYAYFSEGVKRKFRSPKIEPFSGKMERLATSGEIYRLFLAEDEKTIIRKPNLRYFARDNGVEHYVYEKAWLINFEQFMKKLNPKNMTEHYSLPRMRHRNASVRLWNREHPRCQIDKHVVEACVTDERVCFYKRDRTWVVNYDQLEVVIAEYMQTHAYTPAEIRSKRAKEKNAGITAAERKRKKR